MALGPDAGIDSVGENRFGRKGGMPELKFGDGCLTCDDFTCKKL